MVPAPSRRSGFNGSLDGLRGIAALNVVFAHYVLAFFPFLLKGQYSDLVITRTLEGPWVDLLTFPLISVFYNGHFAVMVFFVLSGYVMALPAYRGDRLTLKRRILGRYLRLNGPVFVIVLLSYLLSLQGFFFNQSAGVLSGSRWLTGFFKEMPELFDAVRSALYGSIILGDVRFVPPLWTIRIELLGSLVVLFCYLAPSIRSRCFIVLLAAILLWIVQKDQAIFFFTLFAGSFLPLIPSTKRRWPLYFLAGLGLFLGGYNKNFFCYQMLPEPLFLGVQLSDKKTFYNGLAAISLVLSVIQGFGSLFLQSPLCRYLGRWSYSLYLIHFLVLASWASWLYGFLEQESLQDPLTLIGYLVASFCLSAILTRLVDQPTVRWSHSFSKWLLPRP